MYLCFIVIYFGLWVHIMVSFQAPRKISTSPMEKLVKYLVDGTTNDVGKVTSLYLSIIIQSKSS